MTDVRTLERAAVSVLLLAAVAGGGFWLLDGAPAAGDTGATELRSCTTIDEPGRYVLVADVTDSRADTCIRIRSSDVVLDGSGHRLDGTGAFGTAGIVVRSPGDEPLTNVTVRGVTVTDWDDGLRYIAVDGGRVVATTAADNRVGIELLNARRITLADSVARGNRLRGLAVMETSANNTLRNNTAASNAAYGIHLVGPGVRNNTLVGNTATENEFGLVLVGVHDNAVTGTTADGNRIAGLWLSTATGNVLRDNAVSNGFYGVFLSDRSTGNTVANNTADSNRVGIRLRSSDDNTVTANTVRSSRDTAVLLIASDDNRVVGNVGDGNERGIVEIRSTGNVVANNSVGGTG